MKGFSIPSISIPNVSLPNISFSDIGVNTGAIENAITSALPDLGNLVDGLNLKEQATELLSGKIAEGIDLPPELSSLISK